MLQCVGFTGDMIHHTTSQHIIATHCSTCNWLFFLCCEVNPCAVNLNALQSVARATVCCIEVLWCDVMYYHVISCIISRLQYTASTDRNILRCTVPHYNIMLHAATHLSTHCNTHCNTRTAGGLGAQQHTATHCSTLQHTLNHTLQHTRQHTLQHTLRHTHFRKVTCTAAHCNTRALFTLH